MNISDADKYSAIFHKKGRIFRYATLIFGLNPKKRQKNVPTECSAFVSTLYANKKFCRNSKKAPKIQTLCLIFLPKFWKTAEIMRYKLLEKFDNNDTVSYGCIRVALVLQP